MAEVCSLTNSVIGNMFLSAIKFSQHGDVITDHGGTIHLRNNAGPGATVEFTLPVSGSETPSPPS